MIPDGKSPEDFTILTYAWIFGLATLGGFVSFAKRVISTGKWKIGELFVEIATSAFAGVITFYLCQWADISQIGTAALVGIAGHSSSKAIAVFDQLLTDVLSKIQK
jgi:hypothetical protein